jgi:hypothetical protein
MQIDNFSRRVTVSGERTRPRVGFGVAAKQSLARSASPCGARVNAKVRDRETRSPAGVTRALPRHCAFALEHDSSIVCALQ